MLLYYHIDCTKNIKDIINLDYPYVRTFNLYLH